MDKNEKQICDDKNVSTGPPIPLKRHHRLSSQLRRLSIDEFRQGNTAQLPLFAVKRTISETSELKMATPQELERQALMAKLRGIESRQIARGEPKRARLDSEDEDIADSVSLDIVSTYTASATLIVGQNGISFTSHEFAGIRTNILFDTIKTCYSMEEKDAIQEYKIISGIPIVLFPSSQHRATMMYINQFKAKARSIGDKVFELRDFSANEMKSYITIGTNLAASPLSDVTKGNLKALNPQIDADVWQLQNFGTWEKDGLNFATYKCDDPTQADAIQSLNDSLDRGSRHIRGSEQITIMSAFEKFQMQISTLSDDAIVRYCDDLNLEYSEKQTGIIRKSKKKDYPTEESMRKVFYLLPRRKLATTPYRH